MNRCCNIYCYQQILHTNYNSYHLNYKAKQGLNLKLS